MATALPSKTSFNTFSRWTAARLKISSKTCRRLRPHNKRHVLPLRQMDPSLHGAIKIQQVTALSWKFDFDLVTALRAPQNMDVQKKWLMARVLTAIPCNYCVQSGEEDELLNKDNDK